MDEWKPAFVHETYPGRQCCEVPWCISWLATDRDLQVALSEIVDVSKGNAHLRPPPSLAASFKSPYLEPRQFFVHVAASVLAVLGAAPNSDQSGSSKHVLTTDTQVSPEVEELDGTRTRGVIEDILVREGQHLTKTV